MKKTNFPYKEKEFFKFLRVKKKKQKSVKKFIVILANVLHSIRMEVGINFYAKSKNFLNFTN